MRTFRLYRPKDESGVSGTGFVAAGVELPSGRIVMEWIVEGRSLVVHDDFSTLEFVHIKPHKNNSEVWWYEEGQKPTIVKYD
jgi:hypothetical protein